APRAHPRRVRRGADGRGREENDHSGSERRLQAGGPLESPGGPRRERRAARLSRLRRQLLLERGGRALDQRDRRDVSARVVVVRQRNGLFRALRRPARAPRPQVSKRSLRDLPPAALDGRRALVRVDFNVPFKDGAVTDDTRIRAAVPTIAYLREKGARIVLLSHFGRPKGPDPKASLQQIVRDVERILGTPVEFIPDPATGVAASRRLPRGGVALVENTRFWPGEEANDAAFAQTLAALGDFYVNDAFGSAHRAHASTEAVARLLRPAVTGFLMERELRYLGEALDHPTRPFVAVLGGAGRSRPRRLRHLRHRSLHPARLPGPDPEGQDRLLERPDGRVRDAAVRRGDPCHRRGVDRGGEARRHDGRGRRGFGRGRGRARGQAHPRLHRGRRRPRGAGREAASGRRRPRGRVRRLLFAANWKMHLGPAEARAYVKAFRARYNRREDREVWFFPPAVSVEAAAQTARDRGDLLVGTQDVYWEPKGAFTGAVSAPLAPQAGP